MLSADQRVLIIADRVEFAQQILQRLIEEGISSCYVDRAQFLQLQSRTDADVLDWPTHQAFALTSAFAARADVNASLNLQHWSLLVFLDTPYAATQRWIESLQRDQARVIWKLRPGYDVSALPSAEWCVDHMTLREAIQDQGMPEDTSPHMTIQLVSFEPTEAELVVWGLIDELVSVTKEGAAGTMANTLRARWSSSPASLEIGLRRVEHALKWQWPLWVEAAEDGDDFEEPVSNSNIVGNQTNALNLVQECLTALDDLGTDRKLQSLVDQLRNQDRSQSTCVFVRYRDTATYVYSALEDEGLPCLLVHGGMSNIDINGQVRRVVQEPGHVLVMTTAMLRANFDLRSVRHMVLYDAPASPDVMSQTLARFHLYGQPPLRLTVVGDRHSVVRAAELVEQASQFAV